MSDDAEDRETDAMKEALAPLLQERAEAIEHHSELRGTKEWRDAIKQTSALVEHFGLAIQAVSLMSTRHPSFQEGMISLRIQDHLTQSAVAVMMAISEG